MYDFSVKLLLTLCNLNIQTERNGMFMINLKAERYDHTLVECVVLNKPLEAFTAVHTHTIQLSRGLDRAIITASHVI